MVPYHSGREVSFMKLLLCRGFIFDLLSWGNNKKRMKDGPLQGRLIYITICNVRMQQAALPYLLSL